MFRDLSHGQSEDRFYFFLFLPARVRPSDELEFVDDSIDVFR